MTVGRDLKRVESRHSVAFHERDSQIFRLQVDVTGFSKPHSESVLYPSLPRSESRNCQVASSGHNGRHPNQPPAFCFGPFAADWRAAFWATLFARSQVVIAVVAGDRQGIDRPPRFLAKPQQRHHSRSRDQHPIRYSHIGQPEPPWVAVPLQVESACPPFKTDRSPMKRVTTFPDINKPLFRRYSPQQKHRVRVRLQLAEGSPHAHTQRARFPRPQPNRRNPNANHKRNHRENTEPLVSHGDHLTTP